MTEQVGSAPEQTAQYFLLENRIKSVKQNIRESGVTRKAWIIEWAKALEKEIQIGKCDKVNDVSEICNHITHELIDECELTPNEADIARHVLDKRFKNKDFMHPNRGSTSPTKTLENLNRVSRDLNVDALNDLADQDLDFITQITQIGEHFTRMGKRVADQRGFWLPGREPREKKISTPKPKPGESRMHYATVELSNTFSKLAEDTNRLAEKINQFPPPTDSTTHGIFDRKIGLLLLDFKRRLDIISSCIESFSDERYTSSLFEWTITEMNQEDNPRREEFSTAIALANSALQKGNGKDKVSDTKKIKKMTKKSIKKNLQEMNRRINEYNEAVKGIEHLLRRIIYGFLEWRDKNSEFNDSVTTRKDRLHPKLSESAFRYGKMIDQD